MKRIIISGATSMIGSALTKIAVYKGCEVYAIVRPDTTKINRIKSSPKVHLLYGTLENMSNIKELPKDCDAFYHFAWAGTSKSERNDPTIQEKNIKYTLNAVEVAKKCGCKKFLGAGSQAEYGNVSESIDDDTKYKPVTAYGVAKLAAGILSRKLCDEYGIIHVWGRIFSVYGRYDNDWTMLSYAIDCFLKKEKAYFSSGIQKWNYLNEYDAGMLFYLLGEKNEVSDIYRIASNESKQLREYILQVADMLDAMHLCEFASDMSGSKPCGLETIDERLFKAVNYIPRVSFETGIKEMIEERRKQIGTI